MTTPLGSDDEEDDDDFLSRSDYLTMIRAAARDERLIILRELKDRKTQGDDEVPATELKDSIGGEEPLNDTVLEHELDELTAASLLGNYVNRDEGHIRYYSITPQAEVITDFLTDGVDELAEKTEELLTQYD